MWMILIVLFSSIDHVKKFHKYLNSRQKNMTFTYEVQQNNCISFLDVLVTREGDSFSTFSRLYTNFYSYISDKYKKGLIFSLLFRVFMFTVDCNKLHIEVQILKNTVPGNEKWEINISLVKYSYKIKKKISFFKNFN